MKESNEIYNLIKYKNAHIFVCGDVQMAENVYQTLRYVIDFSEREIILDTFISTLEWTQSFDLNIFSFPSCFFKASSRLSSEKLN